MFNCPTDRAFGFVGLLEAAPGAVELPAVIRATNPVFGRDPVRERRAPVRAELADQPERAAAVLEQDEILTEDADALGPAVLHLVEHGDRPPVPPQEASHPRAGSDAGEQVVFLGGQHAQSPDDDGREGETRSVPGIEKRFLLVVRTLAHARKPHGR